MVTIGGYVIHGNSAGTLGLCLDSLLSVCDRVVAIDSESSDGSALLSSERVVERVVFPWRGFGAARARAVECLPGVDYIFFLDADEWLSPGAPEVFARFRASHPTLPQYKVRRRDWVEIHGRKRFSLRTETRVRIIRRDCATWTPSMIVHESMPRRVSQKIDLTVEHLFSTSIEKTLGKMNQYAFLWAVCAAAHQQRARFTLGRRPLHFVRNAFLKGALWRGGMDAIRMSWVVARYHAEKYRYLRASRDPLFQDAVSAYKAGDYPRVFSFAAMATDSTLRGATVA